MNHLPPPPLVALTAGHRLLNYSVSSCQRVSVPVMTLELAGFTKLSADVVVFTFDVSITQHALNQYDGRANFRGGSNLKAI